MSKGNMSTDTVLAAKERVAHLASYLAGRGWLPATSGNLSIRVTGTDNFCITPSGVDKGSIQPTEVLWVDKEGQPLEPSPYRPSAETVVHQRLYEAADCGCVLHVHTVFNNLVSELCFFDGSVHFERHELLKALGHWDEQAQIAVPIVENFANLDELGQAVFNALIPGVPAVLVRRHGIYAFGADEKAARRHLEALEFLFEYYIRIVQLRQNGLQS